jgi:signal transduction histidine kinase
LAHAGATKAELNLAATDTHLVLTYHDNGKGYDKESSATKKGLGLRNIDSRVNMIKGKITTESTPGNGVTVIIEIPFTSYENDHQHSSSGRSGTLP